MSSQSVSRSIVILLLCSGARRKGSPLSSSYLALSPLLSPSGRLSAELLFSFLAHSPFPLADDDDCDDHTKDWPASGLFFPFSLTPFRRLGGGVQA